jgi:hypothetical protein
MDLSRGQQYLRSLMSEYRLGIKYNLDFINEWERLLDRYQYTPFDVERIRAEIRQANEDIAYFRKLLVEGGAENEQMLTESHKDSESPFDRFTGVTCTTVV